MCWCNLLMFQWAGWLQNDGLAPDQGKCTYLSPPKRLPLLNLITKRLVIMGQDYSLCKEMIHMTS